MFGAKLTLIVLTSQRLARIDLAGSRRHLRVERVLSCPPIASSELASAVAIAYRQGETTRHPGASSNSAHRGSRALIVLSDDLWNDSITLPLDVTVLLQPAEIHQALAIEAENFSGINAFDSRFAFRQLVDASTNLVDTSTNFGDSTTWWVAQLANTDLASMAASAQACGTRFLGATHWQAPWRTGLTPSTSSVFDLDSPEAWIAFGNRWAEALSHGYDLLIQPAASDGQRQRLGWIQTSAALTTLLACAGIYHARTAQLQTTESQLSNLQKTLDEREAVAGKLQAATTKLQQTQKLPPSEAVRTQFIVAKPEPAIGVDSSQWLAVFDALTTQTPDDCWIESWRSSDDQATLCGRAVTAQTIQELACRLEQALHDSDWQVMPPVIKLDESQLLRFELAIRAKQATKTEPLRTTFDPLDQPALANHSSQGVGP